MRRGGTHFRLAGLQPVSRTGRADVIEDAISLPAWHQRAGRCRLHCDGRRGGSGEEIQSMIVKRRAANLYLASQLGSFSGVSFLEAKLEGLHVPFKLVVEITRLFGQRLR